MRVIPTVIQGAYIMDTCRSSDSRGQIQEIFHEERFPREIRKHFPIRQTTLTSSHKNVLRGVHCLPYAKLIACASGSLYDVVLDMRPESPSYLKWMAAVLSEKNGRQMLVPPNCAHGYYTLEEPTLAVMCQSTSYNPEKHTDVEYHPLDPAFDIHWPIPAELKPIMSDGDAKAAFIDISEFRFNERRTRVLVVGATSQVGGAITDLLLQDPAKYVAFGTSFQQIKSCHMLFDMEDAAKDPTLCETLLTMCRPHVVVLCAAFSWHQGCEKFPEKAEAINFTAVENLARTAKSIGAKMVFYSSENVFDGEKEGAWTIAGAKEQEEDGGAYSGGRASLDGQQEKDCPDAFLKEDHKTNPINNYGRLKVAAEKMLLRMDPNNLILRKSRLYGPQDKGRNFVYQVTGALADGKTIKATSDEISCPTYSRDVALATLQLLDKGCSGIYHCAGPTALSKYQWGLFVASYFKLDASFIMETRDAKDPAVNKPKFAALSTAKLRQALPDFKFRAFEEAIEDWKADPRGKHLRWVQED